MTSYLKIPFSGSCGILQVHSFHDGIFAEFFLDVQDGHLYFPIFFQFGRVGKEIVLLVCFIHHIVKADIYAADRGGFVNYFLIQQGKALVMTRTELVVTVSGEVPWEDFAVSRE